jgi:hypothetical protein
LNFAIWRPPADPEGSIDNVGAFCRTQPLSLL